MTPKIIVSIYVLTTSLGLIMLKLGTDSKLPISYVDDKLKFNLNAYTVSGFLLYGASFVLYVYLISKFDLGYIIPLTASFVYIIVFTASFLIFKEAFTATKIIGIVLILAGLFFLNASK